MWENQVCEIISSYQLAESTFWRTIQQQPKLGLLRIDHGSKQKASNEHLHSIAQSYQTMLWDSITITTTATSANSIDTTLIPTTQVLVRAAHTSKVAQ